MTPRDWHGAALDRTRKRAALAAWNRRHGFESGPASVAQGW